MEDASYLDLKDTLIKVLEQKGFMEKLRAEVRAELFHEVRRAADEHHQPCFLRLPFLPRPHRRRPRHTRLTLEQTARSSPSTRLCQPASCS